MNKKISVGVAVALMFLAMAVTATVSVIASMNLFDSKVISVKSSASMYDKLYEMNSVVNSNFYYDVSADAVKNAVGDGYIAGLGDPDTAYLTPEEIEKRAVDAEGMMTSVGVEVIKDAISGYFVVQKVYDGSSADEAGMLPQDVIIDIDGNNISAIDEATAFSLLEGAEGSRSSITYTRNTEESTVELTRSKIEAESVFGALDNGNYYIRIREFCNTTAEQFADVVKDAVESDADGIILDLRDLFGGYDLKVAADILDILLPAGTTISAEYKGEAVKVLYTSDADCVNLPMVVLVNENTVGYSELVAAVLADSGNCSIVGKTTAGKGTLQSLFQLTDGSGLDLTVAKLLAPISGSYDEVGVKPAYEAEAGEGFVLADELPDQLMDVQYKRAIDVIGSLGR